MGTKSKVALGTGAAVLGLAAATTGTLALSPVDVVETETVTVATTLAPGQYIGTCTTVTPPEPDPCEAAQGVIRYQFFGALVNATVFNNWKKSSPGDYQRLNTLMLAPKCSTPANPQPQIMVTFFGAALADAIEAYACARGYEPIAWPAPNPKPISTGDTKAPTAPGPVIVTP